MNKYQKELVDLAEQALAGEFFVGYNSRQKYNHLIDELDKIAPAVFITYIECKDGGYMCELTAEEQCLFLLFIAEYMETKGEES